MGRAYYYFAATLPMLDFDGPPPLGMEAFLQSAERMLSAGDYRQVLSAVTSTSLFAPIAFLRAWQEFELHLRNEQVASRAADLHKDPQDFIRGDKGYEPRVHQAVAAAAKAEHPLAGERIFDRLRWQQLDEMLLGHYFDLEFLIAYAVKLQILERYHKISGDRGREIFSSYKEALVGEKLSHVYKDFEKAT